MKILLLENNRIDRKKYDHCIENSPFGTIYALSWYLDVVAQGWKLLATDDYAYVMPFPVKRKFGLIPYLVQPVYCQQLGIFSTKKITKEIMEAFFNKKHLPFILLQMNPGNALPVKNIKLRPNYLLYLDKPYEELCKRYRSNSRRDLKTIATFELSYEKGPDIDTYIKLLQANSRHYSDSNSRFLKPLLQEASKRDMLFVRSVTKNDKILAGVSFFRFKNRFYYLFPVSTAAGKRCRAMRFLLDCFIKEHAETPSLIDFEGSSVPSVAQFYESFGSQFENYPRYYKNYLPGVAKIKF